MDDCITNDTLTTVGLHLLCTLTAIALCDAESLIALSPKSVLPYFLRVYKYSSYWSYVKFLLSNCRCLIQLMTVSKSHYYEAGLLFSF